MRRRPSLDPRRLTVILYNGPTSPFGRLARAVSLELAIAIEERSIDIYNADSR